MQDPPKSSVQKGISPATPMPLPDLVITSIEFKDFQWPNYQDCWHYRVYFTIKNQGKWRSGPFRLCRKVKTGGEYSDFGELIIMGLAAGETKSINWEGNGFILHCPNSPVTFYKGIIDSHNEVPESNEHNNTMEKQFELF